MIPFPQLLSALVFALPISTASAVGVAPAVVGGVAAVAEQVTGTTPQHPVTPPTHRPRTKVVHLTFDDGPSEWTPKVLEILTARGATATFFQLGVNVPRHPHARAAILAQGSNVGNHTRDHRDLTRLSNRDIRAEIDGGPQSACVRPPYGAHDARVDRVIRRRGAHPVLWSADTRDWAKPGVPAILKGGLLGLHDGSIILMHDGGGDRSQTVAALPKLLRELHRRGYVVRALPGC